MNLTLSGVILFVVEERRFDYIIAGGGLAGLSLAYRLNLGPLRDRRVLIVDKVEKQANDHTWCFWDKAGAAHEVPVFHKWKNLALVSPDGEHLRLDIGSEGYEYRMVRASDFYAHVVPALRANPCFEFLTSEIGSVKGNSVLTGHGEFTADEFVFDSVSIPAYEAPQDHNLIQHFEGWFVETATDRFDPREVTLFDFRVPQNGECRFAYVLPFSSREALVEFTIFSGGLLPDEEYGANLHNYISNVLEITDFKVLGKERGVIPMSDHKHEQRPSEKHVKIGTAGGWVKPSTGYSFSRTRARVKAIADSLEKGRAVPGFDSRWKLFLDSVLLDVLEKGEPPPGRVFERLFKKNPAARVLRFLDEESSVAEDLRLMSTVELLPFTASAIRQVARKT